MPNLRQCKLRKNDFEAKGFPTPEAIWIGDCIDTPIHSNDHNYYTNKRSCPSTHAIRVRTIYSTSHSIHYINLPSPQSLTIIDAKSGMIEYVRYVGYFVINK
jgi:hypothetical protein